jgi:NAD(P)H-hydrate repair Nnr-like enzyme with NAD(P)H-hydrate epimerase domain
MPQYLSKSGVPVSGITPSAFEKLLGELQREYGVSLTQIVESASYSMAMVVRAALGLSAAGGRICALATDSLPGWIALATLRHLANGGADPLVVLVTPPAEVSAELDRQLKPLGKMGVPIFDWAPSGNEQDLARLLESCHNCILGVGYTVVESGFAKPLIDLLSDLPTPVHCIQTPLGIDPTSGTARGSALFASSTLSLGIPFHGLSTAREHVGRHYVCDISLARQQYRDAGQDLTLLFADQPVVQLIPSEAAQSKTTQ